jgi:hypothetical protein
VALAQEGATSTSTPGPPFTSPRGTPTFTRTPPPRPTPQPIRYITNPTEAYALGQRYYQGERPRGGESAIPSNTPLASGEAVTQRFRYLPLILTNGKRLWHKGTGKDGAFPGSGFLSRLGVSWWYDWQHDYAWGDHGNFAYTGFAPMVWCADRPNEIPPDITNNGFGGSWNEQELAARVAQNRGRTWLIFNEPDMPYGIINETTQTYGYQQCAWVLCYMAHKALNLDPVCTWTGATPPSNNATIEAKMMEIAVARYIAIYDIIKASDPTAKVFCCGNFAAMYNSSWWQEFLQRLSGTGRRIDGVAVHAYPWSRSIQACEDFQPESRIWYDCLQEQLDLFRSLHVQEMARGDTPLAPNAPIWITEIGYLFARWVEPPQTVPTLTPQQVRDYLMQPMVEWLQGGGTGYQRVAWYVSIDATWRGTNDVTNLFLYPAPGATPSTLTTPGAYWATVVPTPAAAPAE